MDSASIVSEIINEYNKRKESASQARGRYQGWVLIYGELAKRISMNYDDISTVLSSQGYRIMHWSSLSGDEDDRNDFAVKPQ